MYFLAPNFELLFWACCFKYEFHPNTPYRGLTRSFCTLCLILVRTYQTIRDHGRKAINLKNWPHNTFAPDSSSKADQIVMLYFK